MTETLGSTTENETAGVPLPPEQLPPNTGGKDREHPFRWQCFHGMIWTLVAFGLGLVVFCLSRSEGLVSQLLDRVFILQVGVLGWCCHTVYRGRRLYCGGTVDLDGTEHSRYFVELAVGISLIIAQALAFGSGGALPETIKAFCVGAFFMLVLGEVGANDPWWAFFAFLRFNSALTKEIDTAKRA